MKFTIAKKFLFFVTGIILISGIVSYFIFRMATKNIYITNFTEEMEKAELVMENYLESRFTLLNSGIDILLSDPRFLASIAEGDPRTAQNEIADFRDLVNADFLIIADTSGGILAAGMERDLPAGSINLSKNRFEHGYKQNYIEVNQTIYQILSTPIYFYGMPIGKLIAGYDIDEKIVHKLKKLTGCELALLSSGKMIFQTTPYLSELNKKLLASSRVTHLSGKTHTAQYADEDYLLLLHPLHDNPDLAVSLSRSLDAQLNPVMATISQYLLAVILAGFLFSFFTIQRFINKNLSVSVNRLVQAASMISRGELDKKIEPVRNDELGYVARSFDDTRQTLLENRERLEKIQKQRLQEEKLATIGRLAAGIIHDFKSPMTSILLAMDALELGYLDDENRKKYCANVKQEINRMVNMTMDILDYSSGKKSIHLEEVDFKSFLNTIVESHNPQFAEKKIDLDIHWPEKITVAIDPHKFRRVLDNLLTNANEALLPGQKVTLYSESGKDGLKIHVMDNGPGIPEDILPDIFKPFVTKGKNNGTGLGLSITKKVVEDHGGSLSVTSRKGEGTLFTILLPENLVSPEKTHFNQTTGA